MPGFFVILHFVRGTQGDRTTNSNTTQHDTTYRILARRSPFAVALAGCQSTAPAASPAAIDAFSVAHRT